MSIEKRDVIEKNTQPEIKYIPISIIKPNPYQPRKEFKSKSLRRT